MAVYDTSRRISAPFASLGRVTSIVQSMIVALADWNEARATRKTLLKLTDRELFDLGLDRGWVEYVAKRH